MGELGHGPVGRRPSCSVSRNERPVPSEPLFTCEPLPPRGRTQLFNGLLRNCRRGMSPSFWTRQKPGKTWLGTQVAQLNTVGPERPAEHDHEPDLGTDRRGAVELCPTACWTRF